MDELLERLRDQNLGYRERIKVRNQIIDGARDSRQELARALEEEKSEDFRLQLLDILGATRDPFFGAAIRKIIETDKSEEVLQTAAANLGRVGGNTFQLLIDLLNHKSPNVRLGAVYGLKALGDKRAVKHLFSSLNDHTPVRCWWASPKAGGYTVSEEASIAIDSLAEADLRGDTARIEGWISRNLK